MDYSAVEEKIKNLLDTNTPVSVLQQVVNVLYDSFKHYSWVGIYLVKGDALILGPWSGKQATEHTSIPIGMGVCGAAAKTGKTEIVDDVSQDSRYLSCFLSTRSEIVVPIIRHGVVIGEIDVDSDCPAAFDAQDAIFLEKVASFLSNLLA